MLRNVAYVVNSFPEPSETFIADEALSLAAQDVCASVLYLHEGNRSVVHPSARALLDSGRLFRVGVASRSQKIACLGKLLLRAPARTLRTLAASFGHRERWRRLHALVAADWCLRHRIQFIHAHFADANFVYAGAISAWSGIPYGVTTHRYDILEDPIDRGTAVELYRGASAIVTVSEFNRRFMAKKYPISEGEIQIVHCGIDLTRFTYVDKPQRIGEPLRLLNVGRLAAMKAQDVLLKALRIVKDHGVPFTLEVIGGGALLDELERLTIDLGLADSVVFHGACSEAFVRERLAAADLFVLSSRSEGLPVACIEALAVGTPVIATRIFGVPELIDHGVSGMLVSPDDPKALAEAICLAHAQPQRLRAMREAGRRAVEAGFERKSCTRDLVDVWRRAIAQADARRGAGLGQPLPRELPH